MIITKYIVIQPDVIIPVQCEENETAKELSEITGSFIVAKTWEDAKDHLVMHAKAVANQANYEHKQSKTRLMAKESILMRCEKLRKPGT